MRVRRHVASRLLLVSVMSAAFVVAAGGIENVTDVPSAPAGGTASETPRVASTTPVPPVTAASPSTPATGRSPSRPVERTTVDAEPIHPTGAGTMAAAAPVRLQIQAIGVDSTLLDLGLQADGSLEVPPDGFPAGWYTGAPTPGELGPAIIAGHVDWGGRPGVFFDLRELTTGEEVVITRDDGSIARFRVTGVERFPKDAFPTQAVYGDIDHAGLRLITCGGSFDREARSYVDNLVVFAELITSDAARTSDPSPNPS